MRVLVRLALSMLAVAAISGAAFAPRGVATAADGPAEQEPTAKTRGKVYAWKSEDGVAYQYFVPKSYDPEQGAGLTLVLHGSNLSAGWGFANHKAGQFRPDDIVVCPDGTTSNGRGGFNFLDRGEDLKRLNALHDELREMFTINATFLYGHSQGSFFAFKYAGAYPSDVQGVVGHASGVWGGTFRGKKAHHQAIVLMHGTADPVVGYGQSLGGYSFYSEANYPMVRMRSLQGWNHWPAEHNGSIGGGVVPHPSQQLAWVEGMTSEDPERVTASFEFLADVNVKEWHDYAALHRLATRVASLETVEEKVRKRAGRAIEAVENLAQLHVDELRKAIEKRDPKAPEGPWMVHLPLFLRDFAGVPQAETLREEVSDLLASHRKGGISGLKKYYAQRNREKWAKAFSGAVEALTDGYLHWECQDRQLLTALTELRDEAKDHKLGKSDLKAYDAVAPELEKALEKGVNEFMALNRKMKSVK